jgi:hypothetical protein
MTINDEKEETVSYSNLLSMIGAIPPQAWDAIIPHGPRAVIPDRDSLGDRVALNPQPIPPGQQFVITAAHLTHQAVRAAVAIDMQGGDSCATISDLIDDWCPTPWPKRWPWPWPGPRREAEAPMPWEVHTARLVGAVIFASMASRLADGDLKETLAKGADRLSEAALAEVP